jgi:NDP-sugar pyrophosphorylase family protein
MSQENIAVKGVILAGGWTDAGTFESWIEANQMLLKNDNCILGIN